MPNRSFVLAAAGVSVVISSAALQPAQGKPVGPPEIAWKAMTYDQKKLYMKEAVVPTMAPIFKRFDAKKFKLVNCETCHGEDGPNRKYKMPSNAIHPLPNTPQAFEAKLKAEPTWPKWTDFMANRVEPAMGKLLAVPVFDPKKPVEGALSCGNCHKLEAAKP